MIGFGATSPQARAEFELDLRAIRSEYSRRRSLMNELDTQGLVETPSDESV